jgi:hydroxymethylbilane synthase
VLEIREVQEVKRVRDQTGQVWDERSQKNLAELLRFVLDDAPSSVAVTAERAFLAAVEAGCTAPVGALAESVSCPGAAPREAVRSGAPAVDETPAVDPEALGKRLADEFFVRRNTLIGNC